MRRFFSLLLAFCLLLGIAIPVQAANTEAFTDIEGHWGLSYISYVVEKELMNGVTQSSFSPNSPLTRGMFVTILGRFAKVDKEAWKWNYDGPLFLDVPEESYYAPYINWATRLGIAQGVGHGRFNPDAQITREQVLTMLLRYAKATGQSFTEAEVLGAEEEAQSITFTDEKDISDWAKEAVSQLQNCGIIQGIVNADGSYRFAPKNSATRVQAAAIFCRMDGCIGKIPNWSEIFPTLVVLDQDIMTLDKGNTLTLKAQLFPASVTNQTITWISSDPKVATVDQGKVSWVKEGVCTIYAYSSNGCKASCDVICQWPPVQETKPPQQEEQNLTLASGSESYAQKCQRIFEQSVSDPRAVYASKEEAQEDMVNLTVPVWDLNASGEKYTREFTLVVHKNIAATVDQIFREIYACEAQYPIHSLGGFRYEARSEHNCGLAIDINPKENYYCSPDGTALVGSHFSPDTDEYSIPVDGEIDRIFKKYGFTRGIYWCSGYKDYMHYSFFGT